MADQYSITCHLAYLGAVPKGMVPDEGPSVLCADGVTRALPQLFADSSYDQVKLSLKSSRLQSSPESPTQQTVTTADLNSLTSQITGIPPNAPSQKLTDITVIYAPALENNPKVRGLMFDTGFSTEFDREDVSPWAHCPRTGCAVFLKSIMDTRNDDERKSQVAYTTVHELGHVFNLVHANDPCFMHTSPDDASPPNAWYQFNKNNQILLTHCDEEAIYPGGLPFGDHSYRGNNDARSPEALGEPPLILKIMPSRREFLPFEPIELDLKLSVAPDARVPHGLRNELDPAYSNFTIWIEDPRGERRRYRSIHHCCDNPAPCKVSPGKPFTRDLTLFGQSGGYTFRHAGRHRVWITWRLAKKLIIKSNVVELNVRPTLTLSTKEHLLCNVLRKAGRPLFYRRRQWSRHEHTALKSLYTDFQDKEHSYSAIMAARAHWQIKCHIASYDFAYLKQHRKKLRELGKWLSDQESIGSHRRKKVRTAMEALS